MKKKLLITSRSFGQVSEEPLQILKKSGYEVNFYNQNFCLQEFKNRVCDCQVLVIGGHDFPASVLNMCTNLELILKHGTGLDNVPIEEAKAAGIKVCNVPGTNADAVADLTMGLILDLSRKISYADRMVRRGAWKTVTGCDVFSKTLGLLGFGAIARKVADRARGFSMKILAYDPYLEQLPDKYNGFVTLTDREQVLTESQILSAHLPLTKETYHLLSAEAMSKMQKGAFIINTSRGGIVDEQALAAALSTKKLAGAALDVLEEEPLRTDNPLAGLDHVLITPHIGMYSQEAIGAVSVICAQNAAAHIKGEPLQFRVV